MVLVSLCTSCAEALDRSCILVLWTYGALVWPDGLDGNLVSAESLAWRLGNAAGEAYAFWGFDLPEPVEA